MTPLAQGRAAATILLGQPRFEIIRIRTRTQIRIEQLLEANTDPEDVVLQTLLGFEDELGEFLKRRTQ